MKTTDTLRGALCIMMFVSACSGKDDPAVTATSPTATSPTSTSTSKGTSTNTNANTSTNTNANTSTSSETATSATSATSSSSAGTEPECTFIDCTDEGDIEEDCDIWEQDCPEGEKCMPWASDGGSSWNALKCTPIDPMPQQPGDPCIVEENGVSGVDNCVKGAMCWDVDHETKEGHCIAFCEGTPEEPSCDPGFYCLITGDGVLVLCVPRCDPLLQDCPGADLCLPNGDEFICVLDASGEGGSYGDPCEYANACDPGLYCMNSEYVEGCKSPGCCTPFCDTSKVNMCPGETQECLPWYEEGVEPPGYENVGICGVMQ